MTTHEKAKQQLRTALAKTMQDASPDMLAKALVSRWWRGKRCEKAQVRPQ